MVQTSYKKAILIAKNNHYLHKMNQANNSTQDIFKILQSLESPDIDFPQSPVDWTWCNQEHHFLINKISLIQQGIPAETSVTSNITNPCNSGNSMDWFEFHKISLQKTLDLRLSLRFAMECVPLPTHQRTRCYYSSSDTADHQCLLPRKHFPEFTKNCLSHPFIEEN